MTTEGIPQSYIDAAALHIAYEYAYSPELLMSRADKKEFSTDISGSVGTYHRPRRPRVRVGLERLTISFKNAAGPPRRLRTRQGSSLAKMASGCSTPN
jgi:hypothetical protein